MTLKSDSFTTFCEWLKYLLHDCFDLIEYLVILEIRVDLLFLIEDLGCVKNFKYVLIHPMSGDLMRLLFITFVLDSIDFLVTIFKP